MNKFISKSLACATLVGAVLSFVPVTSGQTAAITPPESSRQVRVATRDDLRCTADKVAGGTLFERDGAKLGSIKDFLIDAHSGRIRFAVVSTGGFAGIGDKLHLVPFYMLSPDPNGNDFKASITPEMLSRAPVLNEESFEENRVAVDDQLQRQITNAYSSTGANVRPTSPTTGLLLRATELKGRDVESNGSTVGTLEGVVVNHGATQATAVFKPTHRLTKGDVRFLVPLSRLDIHADKHAAVTTTLGSQDFQRAEHDMTTVGAATPTDSHASLSNRQRNNVASDATSGTAAIPQAATNTHESDEIAPTGRLDADENLATTRSTVSAAHSIRAALDGDSALAHADVQVTPEKRRVVVRGTVANDEQKAKIEHTADKAAQGAAIDFDLTVRSQ